jgi:hypothetical protein
VGGEAVGLDDEMRVGPDEVDLISADGRSDVWAWQAVAATEGEEVVLQVGAGALGRLGYQVEQLGAAAARVRFNDGMYGGQVETAPILHLVDGALERLGWKDVGEIEQGSSDGGNWDAVSGPDLSGR